MAIGCSTIYPLPRLAGEAHLYLYAYITSLNTPTLPTLYKPLPTFSKNRTSLNTPTLPTLY